jgi:hypothetical protein
MECRLEPPGELCLYSPHDIRDGEVAVNPGERDLLFIVQSVGHSMKMKGAFTFYFQFLNIMVVIWLSLDTNVVVLLYYAKKVDYLDGMRLTGA